MAPITAIVIVDSVFCAMKSGHLVLLLCALLRISTVVMTTYLACRYGYSDEDNPIARRMFISFGVPKTIALSSVLLFGSLCALAYLGRESPQLVSACVFVIAFVLFSDFMVNVLSLFEVRAIPYSVFVIFVVPLLVVIACFLYGVYPFEGAVIAPLEF